MTLEIVSGLLISLFISVKYISIERLVVNIWFSSGLKLTTVPLEELWKVYTPVSFKLVSPYTAWMASAFSNSVWVYPPTPPYWMFGRINVIAPFEILYELLGNEGICDLVMPSLVPEKSPNVIVLLRKTATWALSSEV